MSVFSRGAAVLAAVLLTVSLAPAASASAPVDLSTPSITSDPDPVVNQYIQDIIASGGEVLALSKASYVKLEKGVSPSGFAPNAYPSGCSLVVSLVSATNNLYNSTLSTCGTSQMFTSVIHNMRLTRDRWYGSETLLNQAASATGSRYFWPSSTTTWDCTGQGTYTYYATTGGIITVNGVEYTASSTNSRRLTC